MKKIFWGTVIILFLLVSFSSFYVFAQEEGAEPTYRDSLVFKDAVLIKDKTNLRAGPSTGQSVVGKAEQGKKYLLLIKEENWTKIVFEDTVAWVYNRLIQEEVKDTSVIKVEVPPPPPPPPPPKSQWFQENIHLVIAMVILIVCLALIISVVLRT
ncbi:MAG: hypothetical protein AMJ90_02405 [candidate division Zixibacteria bacterium SM23_73_2]|nr:MAG: hypothetical protein AMJ90_02405 [candidate division Zixibacteria bacterium SM23_73_2]